MFLELTFNTWSSSCKNLLVSIPWFVFKHICLSRTVFDFVSAVSAVPPTHLLNHRTGFSVNIFPPVQTWSSSLTSFLFACDQGALFFLPHTWQTPDPSRGGVPVAFTCKLHSQKAGSRKHTCLPVLHEVGLFSRNAAVIKAVTLLVQEERNDPFYHHSVSYKRYKPGTLNVCPGLCLLGESLGGETTFVVWFRLKQNCSLSCTTC